MSLTLCQISTWSGTTVRGILIQYIRVQEVYCYITLRVYLSPCLFICPFVSSFVSPFVSLSFRLSVRLSVLPSVFLPVCLSVPLSVCLYVCLSVFLSVCLSDAQSKPLSLCVSICLSVYLSIYLSLRSGSIICPNRIRSVFDVIYLQKDATSLKIKYISKKGEAGGLTYCDD